MSRASDSDLLWSYSSDGGQTWSPPEDTGHNTDGGEGRCRPRLVAVGRTFLMFYRDNASSGISLATLDVPPDADGDGYVDGVDCDDQNQAVHPGAVELCNGIDDNCDNQIDEGCPTGPDAGVPPADSGIPPADSSVPPADSTTSPGPDGTSPGADSSPQAPDGSTGPGAVNTGCSCRTGQSHDQDRDQGRGPNVLFVIFLLFALGIRRSR